MGYVPTGGSGGASIGGSVSGATAGSVFFAGAAGVLAQQNDGLYWDDTNDRLRVGVVGTNAARAMLLGQFPGENIAAIHSASLTPAANNYGFAVGGVSTYVNAGPSGTLSFRIENTNVADVSGNAAWTMYAKDSTRVPLILSLAAAQSADALQVKNSGGTTVLGIRGATPDIGVPQLYFAGTNDTGIYGQSNSLDFVFSGVSRLALDFANNRVRFDNMGQLSWSGTSANPAATNDLGLARAAASILKITDSSTGAGALQLGEMTAPSAPSTNNVILYAEDNGSGKTRLMALFPTGAAQQVAIEP